MYLNTLFLPLLGGFLFYGTFHGTKHLAPSQSPQVLLFWSAAIGLALLLSVRVAIGYSDGLSEPDEQRLIALGFPFVRPILLSLAIGVALWFVTEWLEDRVPTFALGVAALIIFVLALLIREIGAAAPELVSADFPLNTSTLVVALVCAGFWLSSYGNISVGSAMIRICLSVFLLIGLALLILVWRDQIVQYWREVVIAPLGTTDSTRGLGSAFAACALGLGAALFANIIYTEEVAETRYMASEKPSPLERLFYSASDEKRLVMLSMKDRKVYVGTVERLARRQENPYLILYPTISGYRSDDDMDVTFTSFYQEVYERLPREEWESFQKVLPVDEIASAGYFEQAHYDRFKAPKIIANTKGS